MFCRANDCDRKVFARELCNKHWKRWRNGKDINEKSWHDKTTEELFWEKVSKSDDDDGCWEWTGATRGKDDLQYGVAWDGERKVGAHRYSYELRHGTIPPGGDVRGMCVCHTCDNPLCVNPDHLFLGTHLDNMKDKVKKNRTTSAKTHCKRGHIRNEKNIYTTRSGLHQCRICNKLRERKRRRALKLIKTNKEL